MNTRARKTKVGTKSRHVTKPGANIFAELGFDTKEAARLKAESQSAMNAKLALKRHMMDELGRWVNDKGYKQIEAAAALGITRPRVSDVLNKKTSKFSIDMLIDLLARAGKRVQMSVA